MKQSVSIGSDQKTTFANIALLDAGIVDQQPPMKQQQQPAPHPQGSMDHSAVVSNAAINNSSNQIRSRANSINLSAVANNNSTNNGTNNSNTTTVTVAVAPNTTNQNNNNNNSNPIMKNTTNNNNNSNNTNPVSIVDGIHFTSSQHDSNTVTTTASQAVITVVAPSTESTDMISTQPVVVQVSSGGAQQYIAVSTAHTQPPQPPTNNGHHHHHHHQQPPTPQPHHHPHGQPNSLKLEDNETNPVQQHSTYEDYSHPVYPNSNSTGQMTYYVTEPYPQGYYTPPEAFVLMESDPTINPQQQQQQQQQPQAAAVPPNIQTTNILPEDEYNKTFPSASRMSVQPQTVAWLHENYETADGVSLPRSTLYSHYQQHCQQNNIEPVNAASFGKLIRSVFVGLRTRRLGTRGNSKYHYYGIRVKANSSLNENNDGTVENSTMPPVKRSKVNNMSSNNSHSSSSNNNNKNNNIVNDLNHLEATKESLQSHLGDANQLLDDVWPSSLQTNPEQEQPQPQGQIESQKIVNLFSKNYRTHYDRIIQALSELNFHEVEHIWLQFWQPNGNEPDQLNIECLKDLTKTEFSNWIAQTDYTMYNSIISILLLPNLLKPIPQLLTQQIRNFAKLINKWMINALHGYSEEFIRTKTSAVSALSHMLRRYTSLNHLSTAACAVLKNPQQVQQMINDLNKVDFKNVQEQASWVCQCDEEIVHQVENSFKAFLQESNPYERWAQWCEQVLDMSLPNNNNIAAAKQFFFKWEFYSSLVMRDLTLRSAQSFGSFHLIRLLFDEYIFYLVEQRIAKTTGTTPLQMLGELTSSSNLTNNSIGTSVTAATQQQQPQSTITTTTTAHTNIPNKQYNEAIVNGQVIP